MQNENVNIFFSSPFFSSFSLFVVRVLFARSIKMEFFENVLNKNGKKCEKRAIGMHFHGKI